MRITVKFMVRFGGDPDLIGDLHKETEEENEEDLPLTQEKRPTLDSIPKDDPESSKPRKFVRNNPNKARRSMYKRECKLIVHSKTIEGEVPQDKDRACRGK
jgi:hypothetical protein